jgi:hypothetical protein
MSYLWAESLVFTLISFMNHAQAGVAPDCTAVTGAQTVSFNIAFGNRGGSLYGPRHDLKVYEQWSSAIPGSDYSIEDTSASSQSKAKFLLFLKNQSTEARFINLNYSGHGVMLDGRNEFAIVLDRPPLKPECHIPGRDNYVKDKPECLKSLVTIGEISSAVNDNNGPPKRIFGFLDSCNSGGVFTGFNNFFATSAPAGFTSEDQVQFSSNGELTDILRKSLSGELPEVDLDQNGFLDFREITATAASFNAAKEMHKMRGLAQANPKQAPSKELSEEDFKKRCEQLGGKLERESKTKGLGRMDPHCNLGPGANGSGFPYYSCFRVPAPLVHKPSGSAPLQDFTSPSGTR